MDHNRFAALLDAWQDGVLGPDEERMLMEHAKDCPECGRQLEAARIYKELMDGYDKEPVVSLQAQAAWRSAVRDEKRRMRNKMLTRIVAAAAAVCLICVGGMSAFRVGRKNAVTRIETDGVESVAESMVADSNTYQEVNVTVEDASESLTYLEDVIAEYGGSVDFTESGESEERVYVSFSEADGDFLTALGGLGSVECDEEANEHICVILNE